MKKCSLTQFVIGLVLLMLMLPGCGSERDAGVVSTNGSNGNNGSFGADPVSGVQYAGAAVCIGCHQDFGWSAPEVADYLASRHVVHSTYVDAAKGPDGCLDCHDPIGDSSTLEDFIDPANVPAAGLAAVGCENCHGAGGEHYGIGPIPQPRPDFNACGQCHNAAMDHNAYHPEGDNIVEDYLASPHGRSINSHNYATGSTSDVTALCSKCHTDEGARLYQGASGSPAALALAIPPTAPVVTVATNVQCRTCHNPHNPQQLLFADQTDGAGNVTASAEYRTCTNCHQPEDGYHGEDSPYSWSGYAVGSGTFSPARVIYDSHFDNPATVAIEGYNLNPGNPRVCRDCHNVHAADTSINQQWASSGHAGNMAQVKAAADATLAQNVMDAAVAAPPFVYYDFKATGRASCQRCHTATGASNYLASFAPLTDGDATNDGTYVPYDPANNDFSYLTGEQRELFYCWTCHKNNSGELRIPGAITAEYNFSGSKASFPDVEASNICIACHAGRESGETITALSAAGDPFTSSSFKNPHYLAAAGLMYAKIGYTNFIDPTTVIGTSTYGQSLTTPEDGGVLTSTHRKFGTTAINGDSHNPTVFVPGFLDAGGPCVTCHMADRTDNNDKPSHTLAIDGNAFDQVCHNCHTSEGATTLTANNFMEIFVDEQAVPFQDAIALGEATLNSNFGITYSTTYPYWFKGGVAVTDWTLAGSLNAGQAENLMGACFNLALVKREPAAYVHARTYVRRLLYDTIDFLDNRAIDMSVGATAQAWNPTIYAKGASATDAATTESFKYLAGYNWTTGAWNVLERP